MYFVEFSQRAKNELNKLDYYSKLMVLNWIEKHLEGCENPKAYGKPLTADSKTDWVYKIGDYRLLCHIEGRRLIMIF